MKRLIALTLTVLMLTGMLLSMAACSGDKDDFADIKEKGFFYCGITIYEPMNYYDADGNLVGFDTEFANAVAEELGLTAKFVTIDWKSKYVELESGAIDCIWNGFTYGNEENGVSRTEYVDFSSAYMNNSQCVVVRSANKDTLNTKDALVGKSAMAEASSAGETAAKDLIGAQGTYTAATAQSNALMELTAGNVDFAVIDVLMAQAMVGKGDYSSLAIADGIELDQEVYAIGFRRGSNFTAEVNKAIQAIQADGTLATIAAKYGVTDALIPNIGK